MIDTGVDFAIYDQAGRLVAVAEAKKRPGITPAWAREWARNFLAHGGATSPPYLLLFTPQQVFLWRRPGESEETEPTYILNANTLFGSYYSRPGVDPQRISPEGFELLVGSWLHDVLHRPWPTSDEDVRSLEQSGFLEAVRDGHLESDQPA